MPIITVTPATAPPATIVDVSGSQFDPKAKYDLTTIDANGDESGKADPAWSAAQDRPKRDGTFSTGILVPPIAGPSKILAYQRGVVVASADVMVAVAPPVTPPSTYTFFDDFSGTTLDPKWGHHWSCCGSVKMDPSLTTVNNGLHLTAVNRSGQWYSDLIDTRDSFKQTYGLFEARIKSVNGPGLWPAFWLYAGVFGTDGNEIDIVELLGSESMKAAHQTVHAGTMSNEVYAPWSAITQFGAATDFHVYAVDWRADHIAFLIDGKETWRETTHLIAKPLSILLNLGVGGWGGTPTSSTPSPAEMTVSWVRASK